MRNKSGFSLVEVIVAAVIFSLTILGLSGVFIAANKNTIHARERITSAEIGKFFLDPLQDHVRQDTWNQAGNELRLTAAGATRAGVGSPQTINNRSFSEVHDVKGVPNTNLRRVISRISWTE
ncbi:MAG: prepilin-type N-terminal cleavage/methylation domain-containing protein [Candidatus Omnitrophica bacterium]|nr:prepilin-type N-terminal cleavage/methylation domain-containing protein [Candidatus Omnitrophota bacterium]